MCVFVQTFTHYQNVQKSPLHGRQYNNVVPFFHTTDEKKEKKLQKKGENISKIQIASHHNFRVHHLQQQLYQ